MFYKYRQYITSDVTEPSDAAGGGGGAGGGETNVLLNLRYLFLM